MRRCASSASFPATKNSRLSRNKPLLVVGHRNPDTDSIYAAISSAQNKTEVAGVHAVAFRAGSINRQTRFALDAIGADDPH